MLCFKALNPLARAAVILALPALARAGENLLPEGSDFEAGWNGFDITPIAMLEDWPAHVPPCLDSAAAASGKNSLKLTNVSGREVFRIYSRAVRLENYKGPLTLSVYAKTDSPGAELRLAVKNGYGDIMSGAASLGKEWKRFHVTAEPKTWWFPQSQGAPHTLYVEMKIVPRVPWKTIWLDAVQLEKGGLGEYKNPAAMDLAFTWDRKIKVYNPGETPRLTLHAAAARDIAGESVTAETEELFSGKKESPVQLRLEPESDARHCRADIPLSAKPRGLYRITVRTADGSSFQQSAWGVINPQGKLPREQRAFFGGSIETVSSVFANQWLFPVIPGESSLASWGGHPEEMFALARDLGWGWWHPYWAFSFMAIQPEGPDKFRWRDSDAMLELARKYDLEIYSNISAASGSEAQPKWALTKTLTRGGTYDVYAGKPLVDAEKYGAFAGAAAEHYKGRISMWEVFNEPGVKMCAEQYAPIQREVYRNIKRASPSARVFGLCGTWDVGGDLYGWIRACLEKEKLGPLMDGIAIHGYHAKDKNYVSRVRELAKQLTGKEYPVIDSESGGGNGAVYPHLPDAFNAVNSNESLSSPESLVRHLVCETACGAERQSWFNLAGMGFIAMRDYSLLEYDGAPGMSLIAYNTLIERLAPAKFCSEIPLDGGVACYVFSSGEGSLAVMWADDDRRQLLIPLPEASAAVENMAGQKMDVPFGGDGLRLALDRKAVYLRCPRLGAAELAGILRKTSIPDLHGVTVSNVRLGHGDDGKPCLDVAVKGGLAAPRPGAVEIIDRPEDWRFAKHRVDYQSVPLNVTKVLRFPLLSAGLDSDRGIKIAADELSGISTSKFNLKIWPARRLAETPEGAAPDWRESDFHCLSDWVSMGMAWDGKGLYAEARVGDTTPRNYQETPGKAPYQSDCVEFFFNPDPGSAPLKNPAYGPGDFQLICDVRGGGDTNDSVHVFGNRTVRPGEVKMTTVRDEKGYRTDIFIPWACFPKTWRPEEGNFMGFSVSVRDVDNDYADIRRVIWAGDNDNYKRTDNLGALVLGSAR